jgi:putative Ig domain-containing protein
MKHRLIRLRIVLAILLFVSLPVVFGTYVPRGAHDQQYAFAAMKLQQATGILGSPPSSRTDDGKSQTGVIESDLLANTVTNGPLTMTVPASETVRAGSSITFNINASEPSYTNFTITLTATGLPNGASLAVASGNPVVSTFAWAPSATQAQGNYTVSFTASNNAKPPITATGTVTVQVLKAMLLPTLAVPSGEQKIYAGAIFSFAVIATDLNLPPLPIILSASGLPAGATFNSDAGVLAWTPSVTQTGRYVISFAASNGLSGATTGRVVVTVSGSLLGTASLSTVPDWTMMWVLPLSIGLVIGIVPSIILLVRKRRTTNAVLGNGFRTTLKPVSLGIEADPSKDKTGEEPASR